MRSWEFGDSVGADGRQGFRQRHLRRHGVRGRRARQVYGRQGQILHLRPRIRLGQVRHCHVRRRRHPLPHRQNVRDGHPPVLPLKGARPHLLRSQDVVLLGLEEGGRIVPRPVQDDEGVPSRGGGREEGTEGGRLRGGEGGDDGYQLLFLSTAGGEEGGVIYLFFAKNKLREDEKRTTLPPCIFVGCFSFTWWCAGVVQTLPARHCC
mmetsp:Transcript_5347/g.15599  ORF Transcript_5347/g.15599 Transcript_5347/m.15599 type:complete len:207 (+) Transcript_5347:419-1039(+)